MEAGSKYFKENTAETMQYLKKQEEEGNDLEAKKYLRNLPDDAKSRVKSNLDNFDKYGTDTGLGDEFEKAKKFA